MDEPNEIFKFKILTIPSKSHHSKKNPTDINKSMKNLIQAKNYVTQSINRLEAQMNHLIKDKDEETLPNTIQPFTISLDSVLNTLTKIQSHHTNLNLTNHNF